MLTGPSGRPDHAFVLAIERASSVPIQIATPRNSPMDTAIPCTTRGLEAANTKPSATAVDIEGAEFECAHDQHKATQVAQPSSQTCC
jgi:hypothetical protein